MTPEFIQSRITELRRKKGISEYQLSRDLGRSRGYIYNISSGKSLPGIKEIFSICEYFSITPALFFDESVEDPAAFRKASEGLRKLSPDDLRLVMKLIDRLGREC